jgi:predicted transcriptional regulator
MEIKYLIGLTEKALDNLEQYGALGELIYSEIYNKLEKMEEYIKTLEKMKIENNSLKAISDLQIVESYIDGQMIPITSEIKETLGFETIKEVRDYLKLSVESYLKLYNKISEEKNKKSLKKLKNLLTENKNQEKK